MRALRTAAGRLIALVMSILPTGVAADDGRYTDRESLGAASHFRVARPTNALEPLRQFYVEGLGLEVIAEFVGHDGFDGLILRQPGGSVQIEFTIAYGHEAPRAPTQDHLVVFYLELPDAYDEVVERMRVAGHSPVAAFNPYWDRYGVTFEDPDGYRVVVVNGSFPPS